MCRIAILVEYPTVNGGENSILAVLGHLLNRQSPEAEFEFCVLGPSKGAMADRASNLGIPIVELNLFDDSGIRLPKEQAIPRLLDAAETSGADLIHGTAWRWDDCWGLLRESSLNWWRRRICVTS